MLKNYICSILFGLLFISGYAFSEPIQNKTLADVKTELIKEMKTDGYLSDKMASEVALKYVKKEDTSQYITSESIVVSTDNSTSNWKSYISLINFIKVIAIVFLLIAFSGIIKNIFVYFAFLIMAIPAYVYQSICILAAVFGLIKPELISKTEYFYVALFCSFALPATLVWMFSWYENLKLYVKKLFNLGIDPAVIISFYGLIYFTVLAFAYESSIFGFFAAVCLSGLFSFSIIYVPGVITLDFKDKLMPAIIVSHTVLLSAFTYLNYNGIVENYLSYFSVGIQYYCTIALGLALLVGSSSLNDDKHKIKYMLAFIAIVMLASFGYFFWDIKVIASILICFFVLLLLEWLGNFGYNINFIAGTAILGSALYSIAMLLEKYSSMIILYIN